MDGELVESVRLGSWWRGALVERPHTSARTQHVHSLATAAWATPSKAAWAQLAALEMAVVVAAVEQAALGDEC